MPVSRLSESTPLQVSTVDAVVIVPGIMGSALKLVRPEGEQQVWGTSSALKSAVRLRARSRIDLLRVRDVDESDDGGRIVPSGLLMLPAWLPGLGGMEPYKRLLRTVRETVLHPAAVLPFAYDWRLDVEYNARILAREARAHLEEWRNHEVLREVRAHRNDDREPRLVFVAHSMGGLVVQAMAGLPIEQPDTRTVITLGTPFAGSVKTVRLLADGRGGPPGLPAEAIRQACLSMPGVYDLLPWYRCRLKDDDVVALREADVVALDAPEHLVRQAFERHTRITTGALPGHQPVVGVGQGTPQSLTIDGDEVITYDWAYRRDSRDELIRESGKLVTENHDGDGTVFRYSARTSSAEGVAVAQHHQSLGAGRASLRMVRKVLTEATDLETVLGDGPDATPLGLEVAEEAGPGEPLQIRIRSDHTPADITCAVEDTASNDAVVRRPKVRGRSQEGAFVVRTDLDVPGLYRVRIAAGNAEVTKLVMVGGDQADAG